MVKTQFLTPIVTSSTCWDSVLKTSVTFLKMQSVSVSIFSRLYHNIVIIEYQTNINTHIVKTQFYTPVEISIAYKDSAMKLC